MRSGKAAPGLSQIVRDITGNNARSSDLVAGYFAGQAVEVSPGDRCLKGG
jgi:hypothetical protein